MRYDITDFGADRTVVPWESDMMVERGDPVIEDCNFRLKKKSAERI